MMWLIKKHPSSLKQTKYEYEDNGPKRKRENTATNFVRTFSCYDEVTTGITRHGLQEFTSTAFSKFLKSY